MIRGDFRKTFFHVLLTFSRQSLGGLVQFGLFALISYRLGTKDAGLYVVALMLPSAMSELLSLGLPASNIYFISSGRYSIGQVWSSSVKAIPIISIVGVLTGAGIVCTAGQALFPGLSKAILYTSLLLFPLMLSLSVVLSFFLALQRFKPYNVLVFSQPVVVFLFLLPVLFSSGATLQNLFLVLLLAHSTVLAFSVYQLSRHISVVPKWNESQNYLKHAFPYGIKANLSNALAFLNYRLDLFFVNFFAGAPAVAAYNVAVYLAEQLWIISKAYTTVLFPILSSFGDDEDRRRYFTTTMSWSVLWITALGAILLAVISDPLVDFIFSIEFESSVNAIYVLLPGVVIFSCVRVLANDLASRGMVEYNLIIAFLVLIVNTIANLIFIPEFGILGAAFATTLSYVLNLIIRLYLNDLKFGIAWWTLLFPKCSELLYITRRALDWLKL